MATYYVATTGNDGFAGSLAFPWQTLSVAVSRMVAGDILYCRAGTYTGDANILNASLTTIPSGSSWAVPILIAAYQQEVVILQPPNNRAAVELHGQSYLIFQDLVFDGQLNTNPAISAVFYTDTVTHHVRLLRCEIENGYVNGLTFGRNGGASHHCEMIGGSSHDNGRDLSGTNTGYGIYSYSNDNLYDGVEVYNNHGYGIHLNPSSFAVLDVGNIVRNCRVHHNGVNDVFGDPNHTGAGIALVFQSGAQVYNNEVYRNGEGAPVWSTSNGIVLYNDCVGCLIAHNTVPSNTGSGLFAQYYGDGNVFINNITCNNSNLQIEDAGSVGHALTLTTNLTTNPSFVNAASDDYHILTTSTAKDTGTTPSVVTTDIDGISRPQGPAFDIGAHEYVPGVTPVPLPPPWVNQDIGLVALPGSASDAAGTFTIIGDGDDIWLFHDFFHFAWQTWSGNVEIIVKLESQTDTSDFAKAGVQIRGSTDDDAAFAHVGLRPGGSNTLEWLYRTAPGQAVVGAAGLPSGLSFPRWFRMVRSGNTLTGYHSANGTSWTQVGTIAITLTNPILVGIAVCSQNNAATSTAVFSSIDVSLPEDVSWYPVYPDRIYRKPSPAPYALFIFRPTRVLPNVPTLGLHRRYPDRLYTKPSRAEQTVTTVRPIAPILPTALVTVWIPQYPSQIFTTPRNSQLMPSVSFPTDPQPNVAEPYKSFVFYPDRFYPIPSRGPIPTLVQPISPLPNAAAPDGGWSQTSWLPRRPASRLSAGLAAMPIPNPVVMIPLRFRPLIVDVMRRKSSVAWMPQTAFPFGAQIIIAQQRFARAIYPDYLYRRTLPRVGTSLWQVTPSIVIQDVICVEWTDETLTRPQLTGEILLRPQMIGEVLIRPQVTGEDLC